MSSYTMPPNNCLDCDWKQFTPWHVDNAGELFCLGTDDEMEDKARSIKRYLDWTQRRHVKPPAWCPKGARP